MKNSKNNLLRIHNKFAHKCSIMVLHCGEVTPMWGLQWHVGHLLVPVSFPFFIFLSSWLHTYPLPFPCLLLSSSQSSAILALIYSPFSAVFFYLSQLSYQLGIQHSLHGSVFHLILTKSPSDKLYWECMTKQMSFSELPQQGMDSNLGLPHPSSAF